MGEAVYDKKAKFINHVVLTHAIIGKKIVSVCFDDSEELDTGFDLVFDDGSELQISAPYFTATFVSAEGVKRQHGRNRIACP